MVAVAAAALATLAATSTAQAATASPAAISGWNLAYQTHGGPNQDFVTITAPTKTDAWAAGNTTNVTGAAGSPTGSVFAHWNGHSWTAASINGSSGFIAEYAYSSSPSNVWIFGRSRKIPGLLQAVTTAAGHAWFFTLAARYPGTKNTAGTPVLFKVTASKIARVKAPSVGLTAGTGIVAAPSGQLWMLATLASTGHREALFHWNGTAWKGAVVPASVCPPNTSGICPFYLSSTLSYDGVGGFWSGWYAHWTGKQWLSVSDGPGAGLRNGYRNAGVSVAIPGTHSVWGVGGVSRTLDSAITNGLVAVYGPLP